MPDTDTSAIIVNYRTMALTRSAINSVLSEAEVTQVVVVDNASGDRSADYLRDAFAHERVRIIESDRNRGFGPAVNMAAKECRAPLLLILNSDATLGPGSLGRLAAALLSDPAIGVVGPAIYESDGRRLQPGAYGRLPARRDIVLSNGWVSPRADPGPDAAAPGWISGVAMLIRRTDFLALGGFDEGFTMYLEDVDLCRRLAASGKVVRREPTAKVMHRGGESWRSKRDQVRRFHASKLRYFEKLGVTRVERECIRLLGAIRSRTAPD